MPQNITLYKAGARDDAYAIDCVGRLPTADVLKSLCLTWHPGAPPFTLPTLGPGSNLTVPALRSASVLRSPGVYDGHLVVSEPVFNEIRAALERDTVFLRVQITDGEEFFALRGVNPFIVEDDPLQTIAQTLQATDEKFGQLVTHVATIAGLLQGQLAARVPVKPGSAPGTHEFASANGGASS